MKERGFSLVELIVTTTILLFIILAVLGAYQQGTALGSIVQSDSRIQDNLRIALESLERELRMVGFGVPMGTEIAGTAVWTPTIFRASSTSIGFRAEIDSGSAMITCTPRSASSDCSQKRVYVDRIEYFDDYACKAPDNPSSGMKLVFIDPQGDWQKRDCSSHDKSGKRLVLSTNLTSGQFPPPDSMVVTVEEVMYRYVANTNPPYGRLQRFVRYGNTPSGSWPSGGWTTVAEYLTSFSLEYQDASGTVLTGSPLSAANRDAVAKIVINLEGIDTIGAVGSSDSITRTLKMRGQALLRNRAL